MLVFEGVGVVMEYGGMTIELRLVIHFFILVMGIGGLEWWFL